MHAGAGQKARPGFYFRIECGKFPLVWQNPKVAL
jgi:hypothetical protein